MLDKKCKTFLKYMDQQPEKEIFFYDEPEYPKELGEDDDVLALIRYLENAGYLESIKSGNDERTVGVCLSHKGRNRRAFARQDLWQYISEKWIDFFALLTALGALVLSIVALLQ